MKVNTTFFGTNELSIPTLQVLKNHADINLVSVVTTEDKKIGRKQVLTPNPVKIWALENNIDIVELSNNREVSTNFPVVSKNNLGVVAYFGYLIPKPVIESFELGILNIHPSLLPNYRGAAPLEWAILNGESEVGVSVIKISPKFDEGQILAQSKIELDYTMPKEQTYKKLFDLGADLLNKNLTEYINGNASLEQQTTSGTIYKAPKINKEDGFIELEKENVQSLGRKILALNPWPGTYTTLENIAKYYNLTPIKNPNLKIKFFDVNLNKIQPEGKNIMGWSEFKNGYLSYN